MTSWRQLRTIIRLKCIVWNSITYYFVTETNLASWMFTFAAACTWSMIELASTILIILYIDWWLLNCLLLWPCVRSSEITTRHSVLVEISIIPIMTMYWVLATISSSCSERILSRCTHARRVNNLIRSTHTGRVYIFLEKSVLDKAHISSHVNSPKMIWWYGLLLETKIMIVFWQISTIL